MYAWFCCDIRLQKVEINWTRLAVGENLLEYNGKISTETSSLETTKIHLNNAICTKDAKFAAADIGHFYSNSKLDSPEYTKVHISLISQKIIDEYKAMKFINEDGYVYGKITGAMYGLA